MTDPIETQATNELMERIRAVRRYALEHYEAGWDVIYEAWDDVDIAAEINLCKTDDGAIKKIAEYVKLHNERRQEIDAEIF
jgi:hypothetical protein